MIVSLGFAMEYEVMIAGVEPKVTKFEFHDGGLEGRCDYELEKYKLPQLVSHKADYLAIRGTHSCHI